MIFSFRWNGKAYDFDDERMSLGEARWVKAETGLHGPEFFKAVQRMDPDAMAALMVIAMRRAGETDTTMDSIAEAENGYFEMIGSVQVKEKPENRAARRRKTVNDAEVPPVSE